MAGLWQFYDQMLGEEDPQQHWCDDARSKYLTEHQQVKAGTPGAPWTVAALQLYSDKTLTTFKGSSVHPIRACLLNAGYCSRVANIRYVKLNLIKHPAGVFQHRILCCTTPSCLYATQTFHLSHRIPFTAHDVVGSLQPCPASGLVVPPLNVNEN